MVFFSILLVPLLLYPLIKTRLDLNNYENRTLITWGEVAGSKWSKFFPNLETLIEDYIPYKNESIEAINWVDKNIFHDIFSNSVVVGKEGWLFYKGENCIQDYRGGFVMSEEELQKYRIAAENLNTSMKSRGIKLYVMITPNKEQIYGEKYLPERVVRYSDYSRADQIVDYLTENSDVQVIYPKRELQEASAVAQVWRKYDTHWNELGAFVSTQSLLDTMGVKYSNLQDVSYIENGHCSGDLANMLGMVSRYSDDNIYKIDDYNATVSFKQTEYVLQSNLSYAKYDSNADNDLKVLFIGDSFLGSMEGYLASNFKTVLFVHRDNYGLLDKNLIEEEQPNILVFQSAERFVDAFDDYMNMYASRYANK